MHLRIFYLMRMSYYYFRQGVLLLLCLWVMAAFSFDTVAQSYASATARETNQDRVSFRQAVRMLKTKKGYSVFIKDKLLKSKANLSVDSPEGKELKSYLYELSRVAELKFKLVDGTIYVTEREVAAKQDQGFLLAGRVIDNSGEGLPGATIKVVGETRGVITDMEGGFSLKVRLGNKLEVSYVGYESQTFTVKDKKKLLVTLEEQAQQLEGVQVVAFAEQKKESVLASVTTVKPSELKVPSSNLTTALAGRMSGVIAYQRSGEPGEDNAEFFIRGVTTFGYKKDPLILIDNVEVTSSDLSRLQPDDIASFSIMKDATATALYGARGANGVVLVTTKEGREGKANVSVRFENSISMPTEKLELADPITYMKLHNESVRTRNPLGLLPYSPEKIDKTIAGTNPELYPTTNWRDELFKDYTMNQRFNFNISGGGKVTRYYLAGTINQDNGILNVDKKSDFNNNIDLKRYTLRSNINIDVTQSTEVIIRFNGSFDDYTGPIDGGKDLYLKAIRSNPVLFKPYYQPTEELRYKNHLLFGNFGAGNYLNPYADMVKGYKDYTKTKIAAQVEIKQDLSMITEGLSLRLLGSTDRYSDFDVKRFYNPYYYSAFMNPVTNSFELNPINPETGTEFLGYDEGDKKISTSIYLQGMALYTKDIGMDHNVSGLLVYTMRESMAGNAGNLQKSLPNRNMGVSGRFTYAFKDRYFTEFNFGYNGSERFSQDERFGFFPSVGAGWTVSEEGFMSGISNTVTKLRLKATYGLVGNDAIGRQDDRFFYLSQVNLNDDKKSIGFGSRFSYGKPGVSIQRYANDQITWETARKFNFGIELGLFDALEFQADYFTEERSNILMDRVQLASLGLQAQSRANIGVAASSGIDLSLDYKKFFSNGFWITGRANFTYAASEFKEVEEPDYSATPWLSKIGRSLGQRWGLVAERLFVDQKEVDNSPEQTFGRYTGGDIKYRDINGDGKISDLDKVPLGNPESPEIVYGFGVSLGYKSVDFSCFFQGLANETFWIDTYKTAPFIHYNDQNIGWDDNVITNNALLKVYADSHWSEEDRNLYATWPRLSDEPINNNMQRSTWFMRDGSFMRLKSLEVGYSFPEKLMERWRMKKLRVYLSGVNLMTFSNFKLWDPEMGGNGLGYPVQKVLNAGIQLNF
ncbi:SusC/RagA family TonB-linked outer membrane protein [Fulvitalea axinellae]|uniref:SusC/RagA family TonB-linked outer membrane protein n=1 Tax=Fulvitalea axinellae TaxID=1182444 RepID=A0AAU9CQD9_9BACT|nr:SusC/RagA family TonB-linked outer membrane protein [Fulvitalea axinellae]